MHLSYRHLVLVLIVSVLLACDNSNAIRAIRIARSSESASRETLRRFLDAVGDSDTTALGGLATRSVVEQVGRDMRDGRFSADYQGAVSSARVTRVLVTLCGANVTFRYLTSGDVRNGYADVRYQEGAWRVSQFALLVEY
jgi:hypothetical protein